MYKKLNRLENLLNTYYNKRTSIYNEIMNNYKKDNYAHGNNDLLLQKYEGYTDLIKLAQVEIDDLKREIKILEHANIFEGLEFEFLPELENN